MGGPLANMIDAFLRREQDTHREDDKAYSKDRKFRQQRLFVLRKKSESRRGGQDAHTHRVHEFFHVSPLCRYV